MRNQYFVKRSLLLATLILALSCTYAQKGSLFIIGGGDRSNALVTELIKTAGMSSSDYIVVLPMASGVPVESVESISKQISELCNNAVKSFNFNKNQADNNQVWIDSVRHAKLIYVTGGDQNRFMNVVRGTALYTALHDAYNSGATISGTSAGAAIMSEIMITGDEADKKDDGKFTVIKNDNVVTAQGMGFINKAIIDQHFVKRSRYNRLLSVLADHPEKIVIGIDESTAIIVKGKDAKVVGESQVIVISKPDDVKTQDNKKVRFKKAKLSILTAGDNFKVK
jgi:cyanophycinase